MLIFFSLRPNWSSILGIIAINVEHLSSIDFFSHNDMDMMEIGNGNLTIEEERTHFAAWAFLKSPILLGTNVSGIRIRLSKFIYLFSFCSWVISRRTKWLSYEMRTFWHSTKTRS